MVGDGGERKVTEPGGECGGVILERDRLKAAQQEVPLGTCRPVVFSVLNTRRSNDGVRAGSGLGDEQVAATNL